MAGALAEEADGARQLAVAVESTSVTPRATSPRGASQTACGGAGFRPPFIRLNRAAAS